MFLLVILIFQTICLVLNCILRIWNHHQYKFANWHSHVMILWVLFLLKYKQKHFAWQYALRNGYKFYRVKHYECSHFEWFIIWHIVDNFMFVRRFCMKNGLNIIFMFDQITQLNAHLMNIQSRFAIRTVLKYSSFSLKQFNTFNNTSELLHVRTLTHIGRFTFRFSMFINSASFNTARVCVPV